MASDQEILIQKLVSSPLTAHGLFFGERHSVASPKFHASIIDDWHSQRPKVLTLAFRGAAKSTLAEEAITVIAALGQTRNCVILGESEARAAERLRSIKHNFETNDFIEGALHVGPGDIWTDTRCTLTNGVIIQAYGRYQSLRGVKHLDQRPDLIFMDDLEDKESVSTPEARHKTRQWYTSTVVPALAVGGRMRMAATPLHPEALAVTLGKTSQWVQRLYPIIYKGDDGEWVATWPAMYPVEWALAKQLEMEEVGQGEDFVQEYLCQATDPASQTFTSDMFRVAPRARSYHAVYAVYDPARTTNKSSATTGKAVCSWIGSKLIVWESFARKMMPDEIVKDIFDTDERYSPVAIGFEENGLNEWALQPIRAEQLRRGYSIPLRPLSAPKGKLDFIRGLQPYFKAGEVEFATDMPELRQQLLGFPTGLIDAPNALAYMLKMKSGVPIYENFREEIISDGIRCAARTPVYFVLNTDGRVTTGQLVQMARGRLQVLSDWLNEGDAGTALPDIIQSARLEAPVGTPALGAQAVAPSSLRPIAPREHFDEYSTLALRAVAKRSKLIVQRGGDIVAGREELRALLRRFVHDEPAIAVHPRARWTLRALAGGYSRQLDSPDPTPGAYAVLMAGLESFAALLRSGLDDVDSQPAYAYTEDGRKYISALARS
jgi:hypothetical protein